MNYFPNPIIWENLYLRPDKSREFDYFEQWFRTIFEFSITRKKKNALKSFVSSLHNFGLLFLEQSNFNVSEFENYRNFSQKQTSDLERLKIPFFSVLGSMKSLWAIF